MEAENSSEAEQQEVGWQHRKKRPPPHPGRCSPLNLSVFLSFVDPKAFDASFPMFLEAGEDANTQELVEEGEEAAVNLKI